MIKQAIIPLAGLGTRLLPLTSVMPKELLPINGRPGLEYILDECINAGVKDIIFVISKKKTVIKKYFYNDNFYKKIIKAKKGDKKIIALYKKIKKYKKYIKFVYQNSPKGTGDAILKCEKHIKSNYFMVLLPDDLIINKNCSTRMIQIYKKYNSSVIAAKKVKRKEVSRWGIFNISKKNSKDSYIVNDVVEKPSIANAPSNLAIIGRYILPKKIFKILKKQKLGKNNELHVTDAIRKLILDKNKFLCHNFSGKYLDCGTMNGFINSSFEISKI